MKNDGDWIPGIVDPNYAGVRESQSSDDLEKRYIIYKRSLPTLRKANRKAKEYGIELINLAFTRKKFFIFATCPKVAEQMRMYSRNDKGVAGGTTPDDGVDCVRYHYTTSNYSMSYLDRLQEIEDQNFKQNPDAYDTSGWDDITGY